MKLDCYWLSHWMEWIVSPFFVGCLVLGFSLHNSAQIPNSLLHYHEIHS